MGQARTKEDIVQQALIFFATNDYERSSLNDIAATLGVTKGAIYHYFDGKDQLFEAAVDLMLAIVDNWTRQALAASGDLRSYLTRLFSFESLVADLSKEVGLQTSLADYENVIYLTLAGIKKFPRLKQRLRSTYDTYHRDLVRMMADASARGEIRDDVDFEVVAYEIAAFYEGAVLLGTIGGHHDYIRMGPRVCESIWNRISAEGGNDQ